MSIATLRNVFIVGTVVFVLAFLGLSYDSIRQLPARTNEQALTAQAISGKVAWQSHDCTDCHTLIGNGAYFAPDLTKVTVRRGEPFVHAWLTTPTGQMPDQHLTPAEVNDLVTFLGWVSQIDTNGWPPAPVFQVAAGGGDPVAQGAALFRERGCAGCHGADAKGTVVGPTLVGTAAKRTEAYLRQWLLDPASVNPQAKMPNLGLAEADVTALVAFVRTIN